MDMEKIIRERIKRDTRSIYRLAKDAGVAVAVVQRFESGERSLTLGTATKICTALGLELRPKARKDR